MGGGFWASGSCLGYGLWVMGYGDGEEGSGWRVF